VRRVAGGALHDVYVMHEYDAYYLDRRRERPLPVIVAVLNDAAKTRFYIDPGTASIVGSYSARGWVDRWLYHGLHSLDFPWLYKHRPLWDIVVLTLLIGGNALCATSLVLAWRVLARKVKGYRSGRRIVASEDLAIEAEPRSRPSHLRILAALKLVAMSATTHVVIIGGGFGGLSAAHVLRNRKGVRITLLDKRNHHVFQPLLYQVATATLSAGDIASPIRWVLRGARNVRVLLGEAARVDMANHRVELTDGATLDYDQLIIATGSSHTYFGHPEWERVAPGLKTLEDAFEIRRRVLKAFERAERETDDQRRLELLTSSWWEVVRPAWSSRARSPKSPGRRSVTSSTRSIRRGRGSCSSKAGSSILATFPEKLREAARRSLRRLGVEVMEDTRVTGVDDHGVTIEPGGRVVAGTVLWTAGVAASPLVSTLGVPLDRAGRVMVQPDLTVPGHPEVFVVGDAAALHQDGRLLPGVAQTAMQGARTRRRRSCGVLPDSIHAVRLSRPGQHGDRRQGVGGRRSALGALLGIARLVRVAVPPHLHADRFPQPHRRDAGVGGGLLHIPAKRAPHHREDLTPRRAPALKRARPRPVAGKLTCSTVRQRAWRGSNNRRGSCSHSAHGRAAGQGVDIDHNRSAVLGCVAGLHYVCDAGRESAVAWGRWDSSMSTRGAGASATRVCCGGSPRWRFRPRGRTCGSVPIRAAISRRQGATPAVANSIAIHSAWHTCRDETKFDRMQAFAAALPTIRARTVADVQRPGLSRDKVLAAVVQLLEKSLIRVGNDEYAKQNRSFGLTTLRDGHVKVKGASGAIRISRQERRTPSRRCQRRTAGPHRETVSRPAGPGAVSVHRRRRTAAGCDVDRRQRLSPQDRRPGFHGEGFPHLGRHGPGARRRSSRSSAPRLRPRRSGKSSPSSMPSLACSGTHAASAASRTSTRSSSTRI
jgi:NADH dehydrogenase